MKIYKRQNKFRVFALFLMVSFILNYANVPIIMAAGTPPTINSINDKSVPEDTPFLMVITINDSDSPINELVVTATSSEESILKNENIDIIGTASNRSMVLTPEDNMVGSTTIELTVSDGESEVYESFVVTFTPEEDNPNAVDDSGDVDEDTFVLLYPLTNDYDVDYDEFSLTSISDPLHGLATIDGNIITYTPALNYYGLDTISYVITDTTALTATGEITINVNPIQDAPVANDDSAVTDEEIFVDIDVLANDIEVDGNTMSVESVSNPLHGTSSLSGNIIRYTPTLNYFGTDLFTYVVNDGHGNSDEANIIISISNVDDNPIAVDDNIVVQEDNSINFDVKTNDTHPDNSVMTVISITPPEHGSANLNGDQSITYSPNGDYYGDDLFTYIIIDELNHEDIGTINVSITPSQDPPAAENDIAETDENGPVNIDVLANDTDIDGDIMSISSVDDPQYGSVSYFNGIVTYTPDRLKIGDLANGIEVTDIFNYEVSDGNSNVDQAIITITITGIEDNPIALDNSDEVAEDQSVTILVLDNDRDPDGDDITIVEVSTPLHGEATIDGVTIIYTPEENYNGSDNFTYTIDDGKTNQASAGVTVLITPVNDGPEAINDDAQTQEETQVLITPLDNDTDLENNDLFIDSVGVPSNGSATFNGNIITYIPNGDFFGQDSFSYVINDGSLLNATATITVTVLNEQDAPIATNDEVEINEDIVTSISVLANDSDIDNDSLSIQSATIPSHGSAIINGDVIVYTPYAHYNGTDSFSYVISDGNDNTAQATVIITINAVQDGPNAYDDYVTTDEGNSITFYPLANDVEFDGDELTITENTEASFGVLVLNQDKSMTYTPNDEYAGDDSFSYTITDGQQQFDVATVFIIVDNINDIPVANDDSATVDEDASIIINLVSNDSDNDSDTLSIYSLTDPTNGIVIIIDNESINYIPNPNFNGQDTFSYIVTDGKGGNDSANVIITVNPINDLPEINNYTITITEDNSVSRDIEATDIDADDLDYAIFENPSHGDLTLVFNDTNQVYQWTYTPAANYMGEDQIIFSITDENEAIVYSTITIIITAENDSPTIFAIADQSILEDSQTEVVTFVIDDLETRLEDLIITVRSSDETIIPIENILIGGGANDRTIMATPLQDTFGVVTIEIDITDYDITTTESFLVTVTSVNDLPILFGEQINTEKDSMVSVDLVGEDVEESFKDLLIEQRAGYEPSNGTLVIEKDVDVWKFEYTPDTGFYGDDTFMLQVTDSELGISYASYTIRVIPVNLLPVISNLAGNPLDDIDANEDTIAVMDLIISDDLNSVGDLTIWFESSNTALISINNINVNRFSSPQTISFDSSSNANGTSDIILYVSDGEHTVSDTFTLTINPVNDNPYAYDNTVMTPNGVTLNSVVGLDAYDRDGDIIDYEISTPPLYGTLTIAADDSSWEYTPSTDNVREFITFSCDDGHGGIAYSDVLILVGIANTPPTVSEISDQVMDKNSEIVGITFTATDVDFVGTSMRVRTSITSSNTDLIPNNWNYRSYTYDGTNGSINLHPVLNAYGTSTITMTFTDGINIVTESFLVTVLDNGVSLVNVTAYDSVRTIDEDTTASGLINVYNQYNTALTFQIKTEPSNGQATIDDSGNYSYTPNAEFVDYDEFEIALFDINMVEQSSCMVLIYIREINDVPIITVENAELTIDEDGIGTMIVSISDVESSADNLYVYATSDNETLISNYNITVSETGAQRSVTLTPSMNGNSDELTDAIITVYVHDGYQTISTTFKLIVTAINDEPTTEDYYFLINEEEVVNASVDIEDVDISDTHKFYIDTQAINGTVVVNEDTGTWEYTPKENYFGYDTFYIEVVDSSGGSCISLTTFYINPVNDAPEITNKAELIDKTILEDGQITIPVQIDDVETPNSLNMTVSSSKQSLINNDSIIVTNVNGVLNVELTPVSNMYGTAQITIEVTDGELKDTAIFNLIVSSVNDEPVVYQYSYTIDEDNTLIRTIAVTDDEDNISFSVESANEPLHGTVYIDESSGIFTYAPNENYNGEDAFTVTVNDGYINASSTVSITIRPVNDAPSPVPSFIDPVLAEIIQEGLDYDIRWNAATDIDGATIIYYELEFSSNGGGSYTTLVDSEMLLSTLIYTQEYLALNTNQAILRIRAFDGFLYSEYTQSPVFIIDSQGPIIILTPSTTNLTASDVIIDLSSSSDNLTGISSQTVKKPDDTTEVVIGDSYVASTNGSYLFTMTDGAGNSRTRSITISNIDKEGPSITFTPDGNSTYLQEHNTAITISDNLAGLSSQYYTWQPNGVTPIEGDYSEYSPSDTTFEKSDVSGSYILWIKAIDILGNETVTSSQVFNFDNSDPEVTADNNGYTIDTWVNETISVDLTYQDFVGQVDVTDVTNPVTKKYQMTQSATTPATDDINWIDYTGTIDITTNSDTNYIHFMVIDHSTNTKTGTFGPYKYDQVIPYSVEIDIQNSGITQTSIDVTINAEDDHSGVYEYAYKIDAGALSEYETSNIHSFTGLNPNSLHTITVYVKDEAGNTSNIIQRSLSTRAVDVENVTEVVATRSYNTLEVLIAANTLNNQASTIEYYVELRRTADQSDVKTSTWSTMLNRTFASLINNTSYDVYVSVRNADDLANDFIKLATYKTNDLTQITVNGRTTDKYYKTADSIIITGTIEDDDNNNVLVYGTLDGNYQEVTVPGGNGEFTLTYTAISENRYVDYIVYANDQVNVALTPHTGDIVVDDQSPTITFDSINNSINENEVSVDITIADIGQAGIANRYYAFMYNGSLPTAEDWISFDTNDYTAVDNTSNGIIVLYAKAIDRSGNEYTDNTGLFNIDTTNPVVINNDNQYTIDTWIDSPISVDLIYTDKIGDTDITSDILGSENPSLRQYQISQSVQTPLISDEQWINYTNTISIMTNSATNYIHYKAADTAGNTITGTFGPYKYDTIAPVVTTSIEDSNITATSIDVLAIATDSLSGVDQYSFLKDSDEYTTYSDDNHYLFDTLLPNTQYTFTAKANDKLGRETIASAVDKYTRALDALAIVETVSARRIDKLTIAITPDTNNENDLLLEYRMKIVKTTDEEVTFESTWSTTLTKTFTGLEENQQYEVFVEVRNADDLGNGYVSYGILKTDSSPVILLSLPQYNRYYAAADDIILMGTVNDSDNDIVVVSATIFGITKTTTVNTLETNMWMLTWDISLDGIAQGDYQGVEMLVDYTSPYLQDDYSSLENIKSEHTGHLVVDNVPPTINITPNQNASYQNSVNPLVTVADDDGAGIGARYYAWKEDGIAVEAGDWVPFTTNTKYLPKNTGNGDYVLWIQVSDLSGNTSTLRSSLFQIDTIAPQVAYVTNGNGDYELQSASVVNVTDNLAGIDTTSYAWIQTTDSNDVLTWTEFTSGNNIESPLDLTGTYYLHIKTLDMATNSEYFVSNEFYFDNSAPSAYIATALTNSESAITISAETTDTLSGMNSTKTYDYNINGNGWIGRSTNSSNQFILLDTNTEYEFKTRAYDELDNVYETESIYKYTASVIPEISAVSATQNTISGTITANGNPAGTLFNVEISTTSNFSENVNVVNNWTDSLSYTANGLIAGTTYYVRVKSRNGDNEESAYSSNATLVTVPTEVISISASKTYSDKVVIDWTQVQGATEYEVYRGVDLIATLGDVATYTDTDADKPTITAGNISATDGTIAAHIRLTLTGATANNGTTHSYTIVAINDQGDSSASVADTGYIKAGVLEIQWQRSSSNTDTNYSNIIGAIASTYDDINAPIYTVNEITSVSVEPKIGTTNTITVTYSGATITDGAIRYYQTVLSADGALTVTTTADDGYRDDNIDHYDIYSSDTMEGIYSYIGESDLESYDDNSLSPNVQKYYKLIAVSEDGSESNISSDLDETYSYAAIPTNMTAQALSTSSLQYSYEDNNNSDNTRYYVEYKAHDSSIWIELNERTTWTADVISLLVNKEYDFRVRARNENDVYTDYSAITTKYTAAEVANVSTDSATQNSISGTITANGNPDGTSYYVAISTTSDFSENVNVVNNWTSAKSYTASGLIEGTTYYVRIKARNEDEEETTYSLNASLVTIPNEVTHVIASEDDSSKVNVTWDKTLGATGYKVYRDGTLLATLGDVATFDDITADIPTITAGAITATDGNVAAHVGLTLNGATANDGTSYLYTVVSLNTQGESSESSADDGYIKAGELEIQWQKSASTTDADYSNIAGATLSTYNDINAPIYTVNPPTSVTANPKNGTTDSILLTYSGASITDGDIRYYQTVLNAEGALTVTTTADDGYRDDTIDHYDIYSSDTMEGTYLYIGESDLESYDDNSLSPNVRQYYKVKVKSIDDTESIFSSITNSYTYAAVPNNIYIQALSPSSIEYTYENNNNSAGTRYYVEYKIHSSLTWIELDERTTLSVQVDSLNVNDAYEFRVRSINENNIYSAYSAATTKYTAAEVPSVSADSATQNSISGTITANGNPDGTSYYVEISTVENFASNIVTVNDWTTSLDYTATGLEKGTIYYVRVKSKNGDDEESAYSNNATLITIPADVTNVVASENDTSKVVVTWTKTQNATGYIVYRDNFAIVYILGDVSTYDDTSADIPTITAGNITATDGTIAAHVGLTLTGATAINGTTHSYTVASFNNQGPSSPSIADTGYIKAGELEIQWQRSESTTDADYSNIAGATLNTYNDINAPIYTVNPPTNVTANSKNGTTDSILLTYSGASITDGDIRYYQTVLNAEGALTVTTTADDGYRDDNIDHYDIYSSDTMEGTYLYIGESDLESYDDNSLSPNVKQYYKVIAKSIDDTESIFSSVTNSYTYAAVPVNGQIQALSKSSVRYSYEANNNNLGTRYYVEYKENNSETWIALSSSEDLTVNIESLEANTLYNFRVRARNELDVSTAYSSIISYNTSASLPTILITDVTQTTISGDIISDGNPIDTDYYVEISTSEDFSENVSIVNNWTPNVTFITSGLEKGTKYYIRVKARNNEQEETDLSDLASTTTIPSEVENVNASESDSTKVAITWAKAKGATGYKVYRDGELLSTVGDVGTYNDMTADIPTITQGSITATDGSVADYVGLILTGAMANDGTSYTYTVVALNLQGESIESSSDDGYIKAGDLEIQWQRSNGVTDENYSNIESATLNTYSDIDAPIYTVNPPTNITANPKSGTTNSIIVTYSGASISDGEIRYYQTVLTADGAQMVTTSADSGYRDDVIDYYKIYSSDSEDGEFVLIDSINGVSYEDNTLAVNTNKFYRIKTVSIATTISENSLIASAYTLAEKIEITGTVFHGGTIYGSVIDEINPSGTQYIIEASSAEDFSDNVIIFKEYSAQKNYSYSGLEGSTTYYIRARAKNNDGIETSNSSIVEKTTFSQNVYLSDLALVSEYGELIYSPEYQNQVFDYSSIVKDKINKTSLGVVTVNENAVIKYNEDFYSQTMDIEGIVLNQGANTIEFIVIAEDREYQQSYIIEITRKKDFLDALQRYINELASDASEDNLNRVISENDANPYEFFEVISKTQDTVYDGVNNETFTDNASKFSSLINKIYMPLVLNGNVATNNLVLAINEAVELAELIIKNDPSTKDEVEKTLSQFIKTVMDSISNEFVGSSTQFYSNLGKIDVDLNPNDIYRKIERLKDVFDSIDKAVEKGLIIDESILREVIVVVDQFVNTNHTDIKITIAKDNVEQLNQYNLDIAFKLGNEKVVIKANNTTDKLELNIKKTDDSLNNVIVSKAIAKGYRTVNEIKELSTTISNDNYNVYGDRIVTIPLSELGTLDIVGAIYNEEKGVFEPLLTYVTIKDGMAIISMKFPRDGIYVILENEGSGSIAEGHWANEDISEMYNRLLLNNVFDENPNFNIGITRAEIAVLVSRLLMLEDNNSPNVYSDTENHKYYDEIMTVTDSRQMIGYPDGTFRPDQIITREEAAVVIQRTLQYIEDRIQVVVDTSNRREKYSDTDSIGFWAEYQVYEISALEVFIGYPNNEFRPKKDISIAEALTMLNRYYDIMIIERKRSDFNIK